MTDLSQVLADWLFVITGEGIDSDLNGDLIVDFEGFAILSKEWNP